MTVLQINPRPSDDGIAIRNRLNGVAIDIRRRGKSTTWIRNKWTWSHTIYEGAVEIQSTVGGIMIAEVTGSNPRLAGAFVSYVERHLKSYIDSITVYYK